MNESQESQTIEQASPDLRTRRTVVTHHSDLDNQNTNQSKKTVFRTYRLIWFCVGLVEALLGFRFVFEILGANPYNGFTQLVYTVSYPFSEPFRSIFGITTVANSYFDWSLPIAGVVYLLIGYGLVQLLGIVKPVTTEEISHSTSSV